MASRDINDLHPELIPAFWEWDSLMKKSGLAYIVTCVARSIIEQMALYVQGRMPVEEVNKFRRVVGLPPITIKQNKIVTWTLESVHITNKFDAKSKNNFSLGWDFALTKNGLPIWSLKADVNKNEIADYEEAGRLAEKCGLHSGMRYNDFCHIQGAV